MGLYDIMDEIAAKQVTKSETGDNRLLGVVVGVVAKNYDQQMPGRICVQIPVRDDKANELKWARLAMPSSGTEWGHYFLPEVGDQVLLAFEHGNIEKPYVIGCVPKDSNKFLTGSVHEKNQIKRIVTKNGSTIQFDDVENEEGKGKKDKISIFFVRERTVVKILKLLIAPSKKITPSGGSSKSFKSLFCVGAFAVSKPLTTITLRLPSTGRSKHSSLMESASSTASFLPISG